MPRLPLVTQENAQEKAKTLLNQAEKKMGKVPNILKGLANSHASLNAYLSMSGALAEGVLNAKEREVIALTVAQRNECGYCTAAHTAIGGNAGLTSEQMIAIRKEKSEDPKYKALTTFTADILNSKGYIDQKAIDQFKSAGYKDDAIAEVVAHIGLNVFTNYFNHVNQTEIDFPEAPSI